MFVQLTYANIGLLYQATISVIIACFYFLVFLIIVYRSAFNTMLEKYVCIEPTSRSNILEYSNIFLFSYIGGAYLFSYCFY